MNNLEKCKKCGWEGDLFADETIRDGYNGIIRCPNGHIIFNVKDSVTNDDCAECMNRDCEVKC